MPDDAVAAAKRPSFLAALISGGVAGTSVDVALYPLDTIKTRLQSAEGFFKAGGFRGVYRGLSAAALGSAPGAALFFSTYEAVKSSLHQVQSASPTPLLPAPMVHMLAASTGEVMACLVRVPTEVVKQRMQAGYSKAILPTLQQIMLHEGGLCGSLQRVQDYRDARNTICLRTVPIIRGEEGTRT